MGWWFGRILTFEVEADDDAPSIGAVLGDASRNAISSDAVQALSGYAAYGASIRAAIEPLVECFGILLFDDGASLRSPSSNVPPEVEADELGCSADDRRAPRLEREQLPVSSVPVQLRITHYDPERDYQTGEVRAVSGEQAGVEAKQDLPAVLAAPDAKSLAQAMLARAWCARDRLTLRLLPQRLSLEPGTKLELPLSPSLWTVEKTTVDGFVMVAELRPTGTDAIAIPADGGCIVPNSDVIPGPVSIALLDIPTLYPNGPTLLLAASSPSPLWKRQPIEVNVSGQSLVVRTAARKSMVGSSVTVLPAADPSVMDAANTVDVQLIDEDQWLTSCDDDALASGANLALIGGELVQFGDVTPLGSGRFRLARLLRGRVGTESAVSGHVIGEVFCLIETGSLQPIPLPITAIGKEVTARIPGSDSATLTVSPRADAIPSPSGGTTIDTEARSSIDQILTTLRQNGLIAT